MLNIRGLRAEVDGQAILKGINLEVKPGEVHAIMGPNGQVKVIRTSLLGEMITMSPTAVSSF